jgi:hypothetical protein
MTMSTDDEAARKARAQRLRGQIKQLEEPEEGTEGEKAPAPRPKSYRELIEEKMRELDKGKR